MSLLKVNEVQNYNGSSLTLTASTVSTSAQLNTGGNISVTGSINVSDDSTTRSNLGLGSIATQNANAVALTGGSLTGTEIDLKSSGTTIYKSDGSTAVISESSGTVTVNNATLGSAVAFPPGTQIGYNYHLKNTTQTITNSTSNTFTVITFDTNSTTSITAKGANSLFEITASISFGQQDGAYPGFIISTSTDGSTFTDILGPTNGSATRATFGGQYGGLSTAEDVRLFNSTMTWVVSPSVSAGGTFYYQVRGTNRGGGSSTVSILINSSWDTSDANRLTGVTSLVCREIAQ